MTDIRIYHSNQQIGRGLVRQKKVNINDSNDKTGHYERARLTFGFGRDFYMSFAGNKMNRRHTQSNSILISSFPYHPIAAILPG